MQGYCRITGLTPLEVPSFIPQGAAGSAVHRCHGMRWTAPRHAIKGLISAIPPMLACHSGAGVDVCAGGHDQGALGVLWALYQRLLWHTTEIVPPITEATGLHGRARCRALLPLTPAPWECSAFDFFCVPLGSWTLDLPFNMTSPKAPSRLIKLPECHCTYSLCFI